MRKLCKVIGVINIIVYSILWIVQISNGIMSTEFLVDIILWSVFIGMISEMEDIDKDICNLENEIKDLKIQNSDLRRNIEQLEKKLDNRIEV